MTRVLVIRHPETVANTERRLIGSTDSPWTARGREQARALKAFVEEASPSQVWSSPSARALKAAHAATPCNVPLRIVEDLREIDFGAAEGLTYLEATRNGIRLAYRPSVPAGEDGGPRAIAHAAEIATEGERWDAFLSRVGAVRAALADARGTVVLFTHGGTGRALLAALLGLPPEAMWSFALPPAAIADVAQEGGHGTLHRLWTPGDPL